MSNVLKESPLEMVKDHCDKGREWESQTIISVTITYSGILLGLGSSDQTYIIIQLQVDSNDSVPPSEDRWSSFGFSLHLIGNINLKVIVHFSCPFLIVKLFSNNFTLVATIDARLFWVGLIIF